MEKHMNQSSISINGSQILINDWYGVSWGQKWVGMHGGEKHIYSNSHPNSKFTSGYIWECGLWLLRWVCKKSKLILRWTTNKAVCLLIETPLRMTGLEEYDNM